MASWLGPSCFRIWFTLRTFTVMASAPELPTSAGRQLVFVIISGFVITHVIVERPEPYLGYLTRRFMRIFPLFAITSVVGYFACDARGGFARTGRLFR